MKSLVLGIVVLILVGFGGFFYRNTLEHPAPEAGTQVACTMEAKLCPDGSSVGRQGPHCEFAACPSPNTELPPFGVAFAIPEGYGIVENESGDGSVRLIKPALSGATHAIVIRTYPIPAGKTGESVILDTAVKSPSDMKAVSMKEFASIPIQGKAFRSIVIERFEGQVDSAFYLVRATDVLRFDIIEHDVDWTNPNLKISELPEHKALLQLLSTLQLSKQ